MAARRRADGMSCPAVRCLCQVYRETEGGPSTDRPISRHASAPKTPAGMPSGRRWSFSVEIGEYSGVMRVPRRVFQRLLPDRPTPERCVEAYYLQRTRFESIAERKLRRRQLTEDGNVEISGRDLR